jgi:hypothetical protein
MFTDGDTYRQAARLYAVLDETHETGTSNLENDQVRQMLTDMQSGKPLDDAQNGVLQRLWRKYAAKVSAYEGTGDFKGQDYLSTVPQGVGRIVEAANYLPPSMRGNVRESTIGKPTIAVDFDGVLHQYASWNEGKVEGGLVSGAADGLRTLAETYRVVIFTARTALAPVRDFLTSNGLGQFAVDVTNRKPPATAYIDDRAIRFTGWAQALADVDRVKAGT